MKKNLPNPVIVTGIDSTHFKSLLQLFRSIGSYAEDFETVVWDLGLTKDEVETLKDFPVTVKTFDYSQYPPHMDVKVGCGAYAWKPIIINDTFDEEGQSVCWIDAGALLIGTLDPILKITEENGIYAALALGTIEEWTHPDTLKYMETPKEVASKPMFASGFVTINKDNEKAVSLLRKWRELALVKECIAPSGSSVNKHHRFDQSIFAILLSQSGMDDGLTGDRINWEAHRDCDWEMRDTVNQRKDYVFP